MLEEIAANILQRVLGRYIDGVEGRNLRVAVWSGKVVLHDVTLRPEALVGLLPVRVCAGFVGRIEMVVPWRELGRLPVTIELRRVHLLALPLNDAGPWSASDVAAYSWARKRAKLQRGDKAIQQLLSQMLAENAQLRPSDAGEPVGSTLSDSASLLARIVDNVQLTVSSVHLRYEDRVNVRRACALGVRIGRVRVQSVDERGRARFVERRAAEPVRKMLSVEHLSVYLDDVECADPRQRSGSSADLPAVFLKAAAAAAAASAAAAAAAAAAASTPG